MSEPLHHRDSDMLRIGHIELFSSDTLRSKDFYRDVLGFELVEVQGGRCVWVKLGTTELLIRPGELSAAPGQYADARSGIVLYPDVAISLHARRPRKAP